MNVALKIPARGIRYGTGVTNTNLEKMSLFSFPVPVVKTCIRSLHSGSTMPSKMPTSYFLVRLFKILLTTCSNLLATSCIDSGESTIELYLVFSSFLSCCFPKSKSTVDWHDDTEPTATVCLVAFLHQGPHPKKARLSTTRRPSGIQPYELLQLLDQVLTNVERQQLHVIDSCVLFFATNDRENISHLG